MHAFKKVYEPALDLQCLKVGSNWACEKVANRKIVILDY